MRRPRPGRGDLICRLYVISGQGLFPAAIYETKRAAGTAGRGCSSMVEQQPSKLMTRVRFPSPAPTLSSKLLPRKCGLGLGWEAIHAAEADDRGPLFSSSHSQSEEVIYVVGRIVRAWSGIEFTVDSSIRDLLSRPDTRDMDTALVLPFRARTELLEQLLAEAIDDASTVTNLHNPHQSNKEPAKLQRYCGARHYDAGGITQAWIKQ